MSGGCRCTHQRRDGTSHTANNDVLGCPWLEQCCVQQDIAAEPKQRQPGGETVHTTDQQCCRRQGAGDCTDKSGCWRQSTRGQRTAAGALHAAIKFLLPQTVEDSCGCGRKSSSTERADQPRRGKRPALGQGHAPECRGQQQRNQSRLGHLKPGRQLDALARWNNLFARYWSRGCSCGGTSHDKPPGRKSRERRAVDLMKLVDACRSGLRERQPEDKPRADEPRSLRAVKGQDAAL